MERRLADGTPVDMGAEFLHGPPAVEHCVLRQLLKEVREWRR